EASEISRCDTTGCHTCTRCWCPAFVGQAFQPDVPPKRQAGKPDLRRSDNLSGRRCQEMSMSEPQRYEVLVLGSGAGGKLLAWHLAGSGRRTAVVERKWIGGSCPNVN